MPAAQYPRPLGRRRPIRLGTVGNRERSGWGKVGWLGVGGWVGALQWQLPCLGSGTTCAELGVPEPPLSEMFSSNGWNRTIFGHFPSRKSHLLAEPYIRPGGLAFLQSMTYRTNGLLYSKSIVTW